MAKELYDFVIAGGGAAGLSLAVRLCNDEFSHLKIALIDPEKKQKNDHTWCSWVVGPTIFDECAINSFEKIYFDDGLGWHKTFDIKPYRYRMLKASQYYERVYDLILKSTHVTFIQDQITEINEINAGGAHIHLKNNGTIEAKYVLKTYPEASTIAEAKKGLYVNQHFKGWFVKTITPQFDVSVCTFMDFDIPQNGEVRFMYVLPYSTTQALIEVAIFSNNDMSQAEYDAIIKEYIARKLQIKDYKIEDEEFGIIPMTTYPFEKTNTRSIIHFGTAGGGVKASTGFAFLRIQKQCDEIIDAIKNNKPIKLTSPYKYRLYDGIFLDVLLNDKSTSGQEVFGSLFKKNDIQTLFKFLDDATTFADELKIMWSTEKFKFTKAVFRYFGRA